MSTTETAVTAVTAPTTLSVSGMVLMGFTLSDWVIIGTLFLIFLQAIIYSLRILRELDLRKDRSKDKNKCEVKDER
jgi:hypothetical protein